MSDKYSQIKTYSIFGTIGSILMIAVVIHRLSLLGVLGLVLVLIALGGLGKIFDDYRPFRYYLYATLSNVVAVVILLVTSISVLSIINRSLGESIEVLIAGIVVVLVLILISSYFIRKSLMILAEKTLVGTFHTAAKLIWYGAILDMTILGMIIGIPLYMIGVIVQAVAFSKIPVTVKEEMEEESSLPTF